MKFNLKLEKKKVLPLSLTGLVVLLDQITKAIIVRIQPEHPSFITDVFNETWNPDGFLHIIHVRNPGIAFSIGENLPDHVRTVAFIILPILVLGFLIWYFFKSDEFTKLQHWAAAGIIGGGIGNIIDRIFRADGVVDFISVNIPDIGNMTRWPTFNVADSAVVICCILLFISIFKDKSLYQKEEKKSEQES